ncbi:Gfo/Idh/MocA family oxidoreductase [Stutzerimonas stutzeri]|uniref:Gfo/Idh/MocA family oxidoreductase n=1 Tax=Stutzerimonas stutzeri TaxID=316 RepID=UPI002108A82D|nr:Gfo/Idh/MocA family oxidoreductase [Stutzerimonas stutzeri]MCQ4258173.1 Gfo/Idh/MocA family oxidoreductase [Stutzerimonas stutzeri]
MKVLIIGLGYAGDRFRRAFEHAASQTGVSVSLAYVGRQQKPTALRYFDRIDGALQDFNPDIVVVSVNDISHASVLCELAEYEGFVICEKPLTAPADELASVGAALAQVRGFALNLIERYSNATQALRDWVARHGWQPVRASFYWGKDRLNDYRPTCGVTSEAIHALDLLSWICPAAGPLRLSDAIGIRSDFSVSGDAVLDTVQLSATLGDTPIAGYSSFVSVVRQRTVDFTFVDQEDQLIHARLTFDTPRWDHDHLRIWMRDTDGSELVLHDLRVSLVQPGLETLSKLSKFCQQVLQWVTLRQQPPAPPFASLDESLDLQRLLNELERRARTPAPARYNHGATRSLLVESSDLEVLG